MIRNKVYFPQKKGNLQLLKYNKSAKYNSILVKSNIFRKNPLLEKIYRNIFFPQPKLYLWFLKREEMIKLQ